MADPNPYLKWFGDRADGVVDAAGNIVRTVAEYDPVTPLDVLQSGVSAVPAVAKSGADAAADAAWVVPATVGVAGVVGLGGLALAKKYGWL